MSKNLKSGDNLVAQSTGGDATGIKWIMIIYFCSGVCSLIDEVVWVRLLKLTLGNTVYASSIVVSVFMGGLALGALIMGRFAESVKKRLRLYAILESIATVSAVSLPFFLWCADGFYRWIYITAAPSPAALLFVQVLVSAAILLVPTMVMGSTLPLLGRYITALQKQVGPLVGRLYALNMLGATIGCFLAGFVLIRMAGVMGTLYFAAVINMFVALSGWWLSRSYDVSPDPPAESNSQRRKKAGANKRQDMRSRLILLGAFYSGLISIGYELIWMRSIVIPLGGFTYVFSAVLTVYLLGNVIGAWIGSRLSRHVTRPGAAFGVSMTALGILGMVFVIWLKLWFVGYRSIGQTSEAGMEGSALGILLMPLLHSIIMFLTPSVLMGIGFPFLLQAWSSFKHNVGKTIGVVYGVNTIGAVVGGILTGFVLIPLMGVQWSIMILGLVGLWLGLALIQVFASSMKASTRVIVYAAGLGFTILVAVFPKDFYRDNIVSASDSTTIAVREGTTTTVEVRRSKAGNLLMNSNGVIIAGDDIHRIAQNMLGHLGILLSPDAHDILSVGFGSGETTACLATHGLGTIDCVEIAQEVVELGLGYFKHLNLGSGLDRYVNMIYMDAKNYLYLTPKRYDVIISDADIPSHSGSAPMFTREHFQSGLEHLTPGGLFITKLHIAGISSSTFASILGTFLDVFPSVTIWYPVTKPTSFFYLAGSDSEQRFFPKRIDEKLSQKNIGDSVSYLNFFTSQDVMSCYIGDHNDIRRYLKEYRLNSDYKPFVEFNLEYKRYGISEDMFEDFIGTVRGNSILKHIDWSGMAEKGEAEWRGKFQTPFEASTINLKLFRESDFKNRLILVGEGLRLAPKHPEFRENEINLFQYVEMLFQQKRPVEGIDAVLKRQPECGTAWIIKSMIFQHNKDYQSAYHAAHQAVQHHPENPRALTNLGLVSLRLNKPEESIRWYEKAIQLEPSNIHHLFNLGMVYSQTGNYEQAVNVFQEGLKKKPDELKAYVLLGDYFTKLGRKDEAAESYRKALKLKPDYNAARRGLAKVLE